jgi:release factor glutamine methyltransferase
MGAVYNPEIDSYLLQKYVERLVTGTVLDMGTGSGIQAVSAALKEEVNHVFAVDINPDALSVAENRAIAYGVIEKIDFLVSDLFSNVCGFYDWIVFNPPYLPSEGDADEFSWSGGKTGGEIIRSFLGIAPNFLSKSGKILMVYSSHSGISLKDFVDYNIEVLEKVKVFFEIIYCVKLNPF